MWTNFVCWFAIKVAAVGIELFVASWNEHPIPLSFLYIKKYSRLKDRVDHHMLVVLSI